jgi:transcriptional regulator with XRE-family HTH domain
MRDVAHPGFAASTLSAHFLSRISHFHNGLWTNRAQCCTLATMLERSEMRRELALVLRRARGFAILTQQQLAEAIGISRRAVAGYEAGENEPPGTVVLAWLRACGRPLSDLDGVTDVEPEELGLAASADMTADDAARVVRRSTTRRRPSPETGD